ncbi:MAG TPA: site-specific integrase [Clostridia bacterium]|nr:site-specific integrase [Clostridia bacterium]
MGRYNKEQYKSGQHALTIDEVKALLLTFDNLQDKAMIALTLSTGLRREDVVNIQSRNFDAKEGSITFMEHKNKKIRTIYIPSQETIQLITMHLKTCRPSEWMFPSPRDTPFFKNKHVSSRHAYNVFNEHLKKAGISQRPFHAMRATAYKIAQASGWTPRMAAELLGDSLEVAEIHYGAPSVGDMKDAARKMPFF